MNADDKGRQHGVLPEPNPGLQGDCATLAGELQGGGRTVELGADGLPAAFRLFAVGVNRLHLAGTATAVTLSAEEVAAIVARQQATGKPIPVDAEHAVFAAARELSVEEGEALPLLGENAAAGYVQLEARGDGLWARVEKWVPRAALLLREKMYRYYSPVIRGLSGNGPLRVTSVALTNVAALDNLEPLAARGETGGKPKHGGKKQVNEELLKALAGLLGVEVLALGEDGGLPADTLGKLGEIKQRLESAAAAASEREAFLAAVREPLALGAEAGIELVQGKVLALAGKQSADAVALSQVQTELGALKQALAERDRKELIEQGLADGKLTQDLVEKWAGKQDVAVLREYLTSAVPVVPQGKVTDTLALRNCDVPVPDGTVASVATTCGVDPKAAQETARCLRK